MQAAADAMEFERAGTLRDQIRGLSVWPGWKYCRTRARSDDALPT
ncbi:MAG TPA: UvrB/UvrC motif-containing protein [bacterium]|nr:UvrB/UvrC motif-containing protein [bacterium]